MSLLEAVTRVQALIGALSGIKGAPAVIPDNFNDYPFVVAYPGGGNWDQPGFGTTLEDVGEIIIDLHAGPQDKGISQAATTVLTYWESIPKKLLGDGTLNDKVSWVRAGAPAIMVDGLLAMGYGGIPTYGCRWRLRYSKDETMT